MSGFINYFETGGNIADTIFLIQKLARKGLVDPQYGTLSVQTKLLAEQCMLNTPPKQKKLGHDRVRFDMNKVFHPVKAAEIVEPKLRQIVLKSDKVAWDRMWEARKTGPFVGTIVTEPSDELAKANVRLNNRNRWRARRTRFVALRAQQPALEEQIRKRQAMIGWARAGWLRALIHLKSTRVPDWVMRHNPGAGQIIDRRFAPDTPEIEVDNFSSWAKTNREGQDVVNRSLRNRERAMETYYKSVMAQVAKGQLTQYQQQQIDINTQFYT